MFKWKIAKKTNNKGKNRFVFFSIYFDIFAFFKIRYMIGDKLKEIEKAIEAIREGKLVIVSDDEDRENEGDFIAAAELITPEIINFMTKYGRGLICAAITEERCEELELDLMVENNTALNSTNFTVSVDLIGHGCTTGISAEDRAKTLNALANNETRPEDLGRPGHIFPIKAHSGGLRARPGHTEVSVLLPKLAGLKPVGALVEIMNNDGSMARYPDLEQVAKIHNLKLITTKDLIAYLDFKSIQY
jgi:3,4-dihydroxy 2-butanone 4-phosphate synthase/GTP cyclohydrolase II